MAWRRPGDKLLSEPRMVYVTDVCMRHSTSVSYIFSVFTPAPVISVLKEMKRKNNHEIITEIRFFSCCQRSPTLLWMDNHKSWPTHSTGKHFLAGAMNRNHFIACASSNGYKSMPGNSLGYIIRINFRHMELTVIMLRSVAKYPGLSRIPPVFATGILLVVV